MPQLIVLALVGAAVYAAYRWLWRPARMVAAEVRRAENELRQGAGRSAQRDMSRDMGRLEYDPIDGVYRPRR